MESIRSPPQDQDHPRPHSIPSQPPPKTPSRTSTSTSTGTTDPPSRYLPAAKTPTTANFTTPSTIATNPTTITAGNANATRSQTSRFSPSIVLSPKTTTATQTARVSSSASSSRATREPIFSYSSTGHGFAARFLPSSPSPRAPVVGALYQGYRARKLAATSSDGTVSQKTWQPRGKAAQAVTNPWERKVAECYNLALQEELFALGDDDDQDEGDESEGLDKAGSEKNGCFDSSDRDERNEENVGVAEPQTPTRPNRFSRHLRTPTRPCNPRRLSTPRTPRTRPSTPRSCFASEPPCFFTYADVRKRRRRDSLTENTDTFVSPNRLASENHPEGTSTTIPFRPRPSYSNTFLPSTLHYLSVPSLQMRALERARANISTTAFKVLDAPELVDDFYLNLLDWSPLNVLAVGLGNSVYLWNADCSQVAKLCEVTGPGETVASLKWVLWGTKLAVGTTGGSIQLWDVNSQKHEANLLSHTARVGTMAFNEADAILCSGSRDRHLCLWDITRSPSSSLRSTSTSSPVLRFSAHRQEVCGVQWSPDYGQLATGGNDNRLLVWDWKMVREEARRHKAADVGAGGLGTAQPMLRFEEHRAAVKAIAWSPHKRGLLGSGGGTADRQIRFWDTQNGAALIAIDTGSQVCNLTWSATGDELCSTHGYSQNQIVVWKYPYMQNIATLTGHSHRVLYLATSPNQQTIVTGAGGQGDETLRFWDVFQPSGGSVERRVPGRSLAGCMGSDVRLGDERGMVGSARKRRRAPPSAWVANDEEESELEMDEDDLMMIRAVYGLSEKPPPKAPAPMAQKSPQPQPPSPTSAPI